MLSPGHQYWRGDGQSSSIEKKYVSKSPLILNTVKSVLRGHFGIKKKCSFKTGDLLKEVPFK
jgi:hypothetical protein